MPSAVAPNPHANSTAPDDLDNFFNYDDAVEDFMKDLPLKPSPQNTTTKTTTQPTKDIDEEITVKKARRPNPKLDDNLLLSQQGLPRLRKITKTSLKFRGKGHEFSDISRLLNTYQLWLDDLFPRAKFRDALDIVEKVGHSRKMQVMRRAWLDETKPKRRGESPEVDGGNDDFMMAGALSGNGEEGQVTANAEAGDSSRQPITIPDEAPDDDDDLDALLAEHDAVVPNANAAAPKRRGPFEEDSDDEDELDALLAEQPTTTKTAQSAERPASENTPQRDSIDDDFAAEEEIMAEMDMW